MGQIPKKILYAAAGSQLSFRINNESKGVSEEAADQAAAEEAKRLVEAGELRPSEVVAYMNAHSAFKDRSRAGEYAIDTAGKDAIVGATYTGGNTFGTQVGKEGEMEASQRSNLGSRFTKKARRGNQADIEAIYLRTMLPKIGGIALTADEVAKTQADKDALKTKTEKETADKLEADKWKSIEDPYKYIGSKYFAGNLDFGETMSKMSPDEKENILKDYAQHITSNWMKYEPLKNADVSWMAKHKGDTGEINYGQPYYRDLFSRLFTSKGTQFINSIYGLPQQEQEAEEAKQQVARKADWNTLKSRNDAALIDENTIQAPPSEDIQVGGRTMIAHYIHDPKTGKIIKKYAEYPAGQRHGLSAEAPKGDYIESLVSNIFHPEKAANFRFYEQASKYNQPISIYDIEDEGILKDTSNPNNILRYKPVSSKQEGGVLFLQSGGTAGERAAEEGIANWLARPDMEKKINNTSYSPPIATTPSTSSGETTKTGLGFEKLSGSDSSAKLSELKFNTADVLEASSLLADLTSLGASFVPGGSLVAGSAGLAGTGTAMAAEAARGELGWEDTGKYLLSGALDAAAFLPGVGIGAKVSKLSQSAPKLVNLLTKAGTLTLAGIGVGMGINEIEELKDKITNQGIKSLTVQDIKNLANGLTAVVNAAHIHARNSATSVQETTGKVLGKVKNDKGEIIETALTKKGDSWVPVLDQYKTAKVVETNPIIAKKFVAGTRETVPNQPILKEEGFSFKSPLASLKDKYSARLRAEVSKPVGPKSPEGFDEVAAITAGKKADIQAVRDTKKAPIAEKEVRVKEYLEDRKAREAAIEAIRKGSATGYNLLRNPETKKYMKLAGSKAKYQEVLGTIEKNKANPKWMREEILPKLQRSMFKKGGRIPMGQNGWVSNLIDKSLQFRTNNNPSSLGTTIDPSLSLIPSGSKELKISGASTLTPMNSRGLRDFSSLETKQPLITSNKLVGALQTSRHPISLAHDKNPTIFDRLKGSIKQNPEQALAASEFLRTAFLNKTLQKQTNPLYIPPVTDKVETPWSEGGDLLTRSSFYNRAAEMQGANRFPTSSDATFNLLRNLAVGDKAEQLRSQGDAAFSQGLDKNREMAFRVQEANAAARKEAADQRGMYATKAQAAKDEADVQRDNLIASNWNTYWASTNMDKKRKALENTARNQRYSLMEEQQKVEEDPRFAILKGDRTAANAAAYDKAYKDYGRELLNAERKVYIQKAGGSTEEYKHLKEMRKERMAINKESTKIANKWQEEGAKQVKKEALGSSKELRDLISKIFSK